MKRLAQVLVLQAKAPCGLARVLPTQQEPLLDPRRCSSKSPLAAFFLSEVFPPRHDALADLDSSRCLPVQAATGGVREAGSRALGAAEQAVRGAYHGAKGAVATGDCVYCH